MTSTSFNVGLGEVSRNSSKVLKPPGGGSSDIFGSGEAQQSPRKVKQYMASNISLTDGGVAAPLGTGPGSTSSAASTASSGETPSPGSPVSAARNGTAQPQQQQQQAQQQQQQQDGGVVGEVLAAGKAPDGEPRGRQFQMQSHFSLGGDDKPAAAPAAPASSEPAAAQDGNPVTGEGYKAPAAAANRSRVPPGGYSSGLW